MAAADRAAADIASDRAVVVFSGEAALPLLRLLRPGFRHCFVALRRGGRWLCVDSLAHRTEISLLDLPADCDLAAFYRRLGYRVVETQIRAVPRRPAPPLPFTCVETVKRVLGLHAWTVLTPWQLYRCLVKKSLTTE